MIQCFLFGTQDLYTNDRTLTGTEDLNINILETMQRS